MANLAVRGFVCLLLVYCSIGRAGAEPLPPFDYDEEDAIEPKGDVYVPFDISKASPQQLDVAFRTLAWVFKVDYDTALYDRFVVYITQSLQNRGTTHQTNSSESFTPPVIRHIRGDEGKTLPTENEVAAQKKKHIRERFSHAMRYHELAKKEVLPKFITEMKEDKASGYPLLRAELKERTEGVRELITPKALPPCKTGATKNRPNNSLLSAPAPSILFDLLFVKALAPRRLGGIAGTSLSEAIGEKTEIHYYSTDPGQMLSLQAERYGATCLPFRIRVTNKFVYFHSGTDALKNYDAAPDGSGILHHVLEKRLRDFL